MSGLRAEVERRAAAVRGPECSVALVLRRLDPDDRDDLIALLADDAPRWSIISSVLADMGHRISAGTLSRHAKGRCCCGSR